MLTKRAAVLTTLVLLGGVLMPRPAEAARPSANLIVGGNAEAGYCSKDFNTATTMPGWKIEQGTPAVICYTAEPFSHPAGSAGQAFFAPGAEGNAAGSQTVDVRSAARAIDTGRVTYNLSAWLGGHSHYPGHAVVSLTFLDRSRRRLGGARLLPVTPAERALQSAFIARSRRGSVPARTRSIRARIQFRGQLYNDGLAFPGSGYVDNLSLVLSAPVVAATLSPPRSVVPRFDHVFMIMMENSDYSQIVGSTRMPFVHDLMRRGVLMTNVHGVYHPSDENYLAVSGGDTFATGAVYWPDIHDPNRSIADELEAKSLSWKSYEQGMGFPCNASPATVHKYDQYYAPDDTPFIHYNNISRNPKRCRAHLVDGKELARDLRSTSTTPAFSWISADDYYDGESSGNGNETSQAVQDGWLKQTIEPILRSPAWKTQRSLLILTWDECNPYPYPVDDGENHVATILVGSQGTVGINRTAGGRFDHYSTGRTIEEALGIGPITANDRYATPLNDAFR